MNPSPRLKEFLGTLTLEEKKRRARVEAKRCLMTLSYSLLGYNQLTLQTHRHMIACLEDEHRSKLIVAPRGSFKSSLASIAYPISLLLKNPDIRILLDSELYQNSRNFLREIKAHLESELMVDLFGIFKSDAHWTEGSITIRQRTRNVKEATITCSGIGAEKTGQHYDIVILDDLNSPKNTGTEEQRTKAINHYRYMQSILEPGGILVVAGTRYHAQDVIGFLLENELEFSNDGSDFN